MSTQLNQTQIRTTYQIPTRFEYAVGLHLLRNLRSAPPTGTPLILGIHGPSGDGKTYQAEQVCARAGVHMVLISGGQLESGIAGEPSEILRSAYQEASVTITNGEPAAVLLNDADAAIGVWGELTQYTVNTQNVMTELMHLADYPTRVEGRTTQRVPILITGNDFSRLYQPLCRPGRMEMLRWELSPEEREAVMAGILPYLHPSDVRALRIEFPEQPIAFWAAIAHRTQDGILSELHRTHGLGEALQRVLRDPLPPDSITTPRLEDVRGAAVNLIANTSTNHLKTVSRP